MKSVLKKSVAVILALAMSMALFSVAAFAENDNIYVIRSDVEVSDIAMNGVVYIAEDVTLTTTGEVALDGEVYVYGTWINTASISGEGTIHCAHYNSSTLPSNARGVFRSTYDTSRPSGPISVSTNSTYLNDPVPEGRTWDPLAENSPGGSETFAVYSADDTSLRFYTDDIVPTEGNTYNGKTVTEVYEDVDRLAVTTSYDLPWYSVRGDITSVKIDSSFKEVQPIDLGYWFEDFSNCTKIEGLENMDMSNVTSMEEMFCGCISLTELDVSGWDTSNVTDMQGMFYNCTSLTSLDLSSWDTEKVSGDNFAIGCDSMQSIVLGDKTDIFTKGQYVDQQDWYDSATNGNVVSSNYLQDAPYPGEYWTYTEETTGNPDDGNPDDGNPDDGNPDDGNPDDGNPDDGNPDDGNPDTGNPDDGNPDTGNPAPSGDKIDGLHKDSDGKWRYYENSVFTKYTGFTSNANGDWYVENGLVNFDKNGVYKDTTGEFGKKGTWYYVIRNAVQHKFTGLANYKNANGWWYIKNGEVDFSHNGVDKNKNGWWYVTGGKVQFGYTGVANYKNSNGWWYINKGKVDFNANTVAKNKNGWWYVEKGKVNFKYTGVSNYRNSKGWWYVKNGKVDFTFNGKAKNKNGTWNVVNGKVRF